MLNVIWLSMILIAVLVGGFTGRLGPIADGAFATAKYAVMEIALPLVGLMAIWLGMMRLAERAGLVQFLARALRPIMRRLFPDVPPDHPAQGAMVLNMAANMLGLGNAATPLGLRAMALLQQLNPRPAVASNAMVTFLAMNTASIQLVPTTAISILAIQGVKSPSGIVLPALVATAIAMICGILAAKLFASRFPVGDGDSAEEGMPIENATVEEPPDAPAMTRAGRVLMAVYFAAFASMFMVMVNPSLANALPEFFGLKWRYGDYFPGLDAWQRGVRAFSLLAVPFLLSFFPLYAHLRRVRVYEQFCEGAKEAMITGTRIIPYIVAMLVAIRMLREAGVVELITDSLRPLLMAIGFPPELLPLAVMRPLSGSASQGIFVDIVKADVAAVPGGTLLSYMAATIYGSTETTFYVLAVYFGSIGIRKIRHAVLVGLTADIVALFTAILACRLFLR